MSTVSTGTGAAPETEARPTIADTSYRTYDGPLLPRVAGISRWGTVAKTTVKQNVNRKKFGYWIPAALILIIYFFFGIIFYLQHGFTQQMAAVNGTATPPPYTLTLYTAQAGIHILLFAAVITVGAAAIAADNRANALLVYLSKPLGRTDYLVGKWLGIFLLVAVLSVGPALLLYLFFLAAYFSDGFLTDNPTLIFKVLAASLLPAAIHASLMTGFSAWSKTPRLAGAIYAAFYFVLSIASVAVAQVLQSREKTSPQTVALVRSVSVDGVSDALAQHLYDTNPQQVANQFNGRRRRRARRANRERVRAAVRQAVGASTPTPAPEATPDPMPTPEPTPSMIAPERAPLLPLLLIAAAFIGLPLWAASARIKAVEVIKG